MKEFRLLASQRISRITLGILFLITIVGSPIGIWLIILSQRSIQMNKKNIQIKPLGKAIKLKDIQKIGIGNIRQLIPGNSTLNPSSSPQNVSSPIMLIALKNGKKVRIALSNYEAGLSQEILKTTGIKVLPLKNSSLLPWKLSFK